MNTQTLQRQMYELHDASKPQRIMLAAFGAVWTALAWWLLVGAGLGVLGHFFGRTWQPGDQLRRMFLTIGLFFCLASRAARIARVSARQAALA